MGMGSLPLDMGSDLLLPNCSVVHSTLLRSVQQLRSTEWNEVCILGGGGSILGDGGSILGGAGSILGGAGSILEGGGSILGGGWMHTWRYDMVVFYRHQEGVTNLDFIWRYSLTSDTCIKHLGRKKPTRRV